MFGARAFPVFQKPFFAPQVPENEEKDDVEDV